MPAPIIPFAMRSQTYPATFEVGDVVRRCDPCGVGFIRWLVRDIRHSEHDRAGVLVADLSEFEGGEPREGVDRGHYVRYFDPCEPPAGYRPSPAGVRIIKSSNTKHRIGVPKGRLP